jgi:hypothetical protein
MGSKKLLKRVKRRVRKQANKKAEALIEERVREIMNLEQALAAAQASLKELLEKDATEIVEV